MSFGNHSLTILQKNRHLTKTAQVKKICHFVKKSLSSLQSKKGVNQLRCCLTLASLNLNLAEIFLVACLGTEA